MNRGEYYFITEDDYTFLVTQFPATFGSLAEIGWGTYSEDGIDYRYCPSDALDPAIVDDASGLACDFHLIEYVYSSQYGNFFN